MIYTFVILLLLLFIVFSILHEPRDKCFVDRVKSVLGNQSPSKVFDKEIGKNMDRISTGEIYYCPYCMNNTIGRKKNKK